MGRNREHRHIYFDEVNLRTERLVHDDIVYHEPVPHGLIYKPYRKEEHIKYYNLLRKGNSIRPVIRRTNPFYFFNASLKVGG